MGHTNKKKLNELLNDLQNQSQGNQSFNQKTGTGFSDDTGTASETGIASRSVDKHRLPDLDWEADLADGEFFSLDTYKPDYLWYPDAEKPSSSLPGLEEICRYVPLVKDCGKNFHSKIAESPLYESGKSLKLRCFASLLEDQSVPWKISKFKHRIESNQKDTTYVQMCAVLEFGIPYGGNEPESDMQWKVRNTLDKTAGSQEREARVSNAEYSHNDSGIYYFPLASVGTEVSDPGVFGHNQLRNYSTTHSVLDWEWIETLKRGSRA